MNARIVAFVACRLLALYIGLNDALGALMMFISALFLHTVDDHWRYVASASANLIAYSTATVAFWSGAGWIARRVAEPFGDATLSDSGPDRWKAMGISVVGALSIVSALKFVSSLFQNSMKDLLKAGQLTLWPLMLVAGFFLMIGIMLIVGQNAIVRALNAVRDWGNKPFITQDEP